ncbi:MAG: hypothetical protein K0S61_684 [Anaerocolumna sp.]|jgi:hypothetical protein|nr:hypothetical protein [Anaerocolumna sp.]
MIELIFLFIVILTTVITTHMLTLKAYREGLGKGYELSNNIRPKEPKTLVEGVQEHINSKQMEYQQNDVQNTISEWLNGGV